MNSQRQRTGPAAFCSPRSALCLTCAASCQLNVKGISARGGRAVSGVGDVTQQQVSKGESAGKRPQQLKAVYRFLCHATEATAAHGLHGCYARWLHAHFSELQSAVVRLHFQGCHCCCAPGCFAMSAQLPATDGTAQLPATGHSTVIVSPSIRGCNQSEIAASSGGTHVPALGNATPFKSRVPNDGAVPCVYT